MGKLGDVFGFKNGKSVDYTENGRYVVHGSNGPIGRTDNCNAESGASVIGRVGEYCGSTFYLKQDGWVSDNAIVAETKPDHEDRYAYYLIEYLPLGNYSGGSAQPLLNQRTLRGIDVGDIPSLPIQRRIADILGALDDKIELNRRMNETLEEMAQALYRHWFVDFGPFQDQEFKDTEELGPIPKEWEATTVGNTTHINLGQSPKSKYYNEEGDGLVFHQGVSTYGWRFPIHERYCSKKKRVADEGDILISVRAPVGRLNIADRKLIIGRGLTALRREDGNQSFLFYFLKEFFDEENKIGSGTVFNSITKSVLNDLEMIGPPSEVVEEFESIVRPMDEKIRNNHEENKTLAETRDYLLPKLISGEIEVDTAQKVAEDAVDAPA
jgi:type I restriction enzyme S subunit